MVKQKRGNCTMISLLSAKKEQESSVREQIMHIAQYHNVKYVSRLLAGCGAGGVSNSDPVGIPFDGILFATRLMERGAWQFVC